MSTLSDKVKAYEEEINELNQTIAEHSKVRNYLYVAAGTALLLGIFIGKVLWGVG